MNLTSINRCSSYPRVFFFFTFYNRVKIDTLDKVLVQVLYVIAFGSLQKSIALCATFYNL